MTRLFQLLFAAAMSAALASATAVFAFDPNGGALSGTPGSIVGWGFTISDSTEYAVVTETSFCATGSVASNLPCTNTLGVYSDFAGNFPIIGPTPDSSSVTEPFSNASQLGYGGLVIGAGASLGTVLTGEIAIIYDLYTEDPVTGSNPVQIGGDNFTFLPASVTVTGGAAVPEPGALAPLGLALILMRSKLGWGVIFERRT